MASKRNYENWLWAVPMIALIALAPPPHASFESGVVDAVADAFGALLICFGVFLRICARGWKHEQVKARLVTSGPYSCSRHPLYLGTLLCGVGVCVIHGSLAVFAGFLGWVVAWHAVVIRREERRLGLRWPDAHAEYRRQVPLLVPQWRAMFRLVTSWPERFAAALVREADGLFLWPMAGVLVRLWEVVGRGPTRAHHRVEIIVLAACVAALGAGWVLVKHGPRARKLARPTHTPAEIAQRAP